MKDSLLIFLFSFSEHFHVCRVGIYSLLCVPRSAKFRHNSSLRTNWKIPFVFWNGFVCPWSCWCSHCAWEQYGNAERFRQEVWSFECRNDNRHIDVCFRWILWVSEIWSSVEGQHHIKFACWMVRIYFFYQGSNVNVLCFKACWINSFAFRFCRLYFLCTSVLCSSHNHLGQLHTDKHQKFRTQHKISTAFASHCHNLHLRYCWGSSSSWTIYQPFWSVLSEHFRTRFPRNHGNLCALARQAWSWQLDYVEGYRTCHFRIHWTFVRNLRIDGRNHQNIHGRKLNVN